jgi:para-aminobenzoate synthetase component 1
LASDPVEVRQRSADDPAPLELLSELDVLGHGSMPRWIGWIGYDAYWHEGSGNDAGERRRSARRRHRRAGVVTSFGRFDAVAVYDSVTGQMHLDGETDAAVEGLASRLMEGAPAPQATVTDLAVTPKADHAAAVRQALEHIAAGDIYQVNLARRWTGHFAGEPLALFEAMRLASPVPYGALMCLAGPSVLARTMETFLEFDAATRQVQCRPIKGTIAVDDPDAATVGAAAENLRADPKERAEHSMIVDLMRNDLGRVSEVGSVRVEGALEVEPYARLSHLVSTVSGTVRADVGLEALLAATFPPGSVTGAPKIRAMEIIEALEGAPRGVYCGAVGFISRRGDARFAVAIRTAQIDGDAIEYHAGGGLVEASVVEREVEETELKARAFLDAVEALEEHASLHPTPKS